MRRLCVLLSTCVFAVACSEPPQKEIDHAQGALDAARAAGADQYASEPYNAATAALKQSREAVAQRDYRLALSRALDASERAQEAAKRSADGKARVRGESERAINGSTAALQQLNARLAAAAAAHVPANELESSTAAARDAEAVLQKARAELRSGNYLAALEAANDLPERISTETRKVEEVMSAHAARGTRRKK